MEQGQGNMGHEIGEVGEGRGEVGQEMDAGGGHSVSRGSYFRALGSLSRLKGSSPQKSENVTNFVICRSSYSYMMSFSSEDPIKEEPKPWVEERTVPSGTVRVIPH